MLPRSRGGHLRVVRELVVRRARDAVELEAGHEPRPGRADYRHPLDLGFDEFFGFTDARDAWEHFPRELWSGRQKKPVTGYAGTLFTDHAEQAVAHSGLRRRRYAVLRALGASRGYILLCVWLGAALILTGNLVNLRAKTPAPAHAPLERANRVASVPQRES